jgi:hypothetical protein
MFCCSKPLIGLSYTLYYRFYAMASNLLMLEFSGQILYTLYFKILMFIVFRPIMPKFILVKFIVCTTSYLSNIQLNWANHWCFGVFFKYWTEFYLGISCVNKAWAMGSWWNRSFVDPSTSNLMWVLEGGIRTDSNGSFEGS